MTICTCCCLQLSSCLISVKYRCLLVGKFVTPICQSKRIYVVLRLDSFTFFFFSGKQCAPLGVHSTKCRHQSPEWTILSHDNCFIQGQVIGFQVLLGSLHARSMRASWWSPPVLRLDKFPELTRKSLHDVRKSCGVLLLPIIFWHFVSSPLHILNIWNIRKEQITGNVCFQMRSKNCIENESVYRRRNRLKFHKT